VAEVGEGRDVEVVAGVMMRVGFERLDGLGREESMEASPANVIVKCICRKLQAMQLRVEICM